MRCVRGAPHSDGVLYTSGENREKPVAKEFCNHRDCASSARALRYKSLNYSAHCHSDVLLQPCALREFWCIAACRAQFRNALRRSRAALAT